MSFTDKTLTCSDCNKEFVFTASEQEFFKNKGFTNEPKRCLDCRKARKSSTRQYPITCSQCGKETTVPFEPKLDRPVYCSECYKTKVKTYVQKDSSG